MSDYPRSFLEQHHMRVMDAYKDGLLKKMAADDLVMRPRDLLDASAMYGVINDLDPDLVVRMTERYIEYRLTTPPPIPDNIILGDS